MLDHVGFIAFFIALYREGLSGMYLGRISFCSSFLSFLAIPPIYVVIAILVIIGGWIAMNYYKMSWNVISISSIAGSVLVLWVGFWFSLYFRKTAKHQRERIEVLLKVKKHLEILPDIIYYILKQQSVPEVF
jgi:rod shape determining protein RodA